MKTNLRQEIPLIIICLLPAFYLLFSWQNIPQIIPIQWDLEGNVNRTGSKWTLFYFTAILPLFNYLLFLFIPYIDPKNQIKQMGKKYQSIKIATQILISAIMLLVIYTINTGSNIDQQLLPILLGLMFLILGNYLPNIKPNYFIGIKTPWTLENPIVWKKTHRFSAPIFILGGLTLIATSLLKNTETFKTSFAITCLIVAFVPIAYSYYISKKENNKIK